jgi:hypothetical protein
VVARMIAGILTRTARTVNDRMLQKNVMINIPTG